MPDPNPVTVFLFTDIEGSTRLWEQAPEGMHDALILHDSIAAESVASHRGRVVKTTGDGVHAVFHDPLDAVEGAVAMQLALARADFPAGIRLHVRAGLHVGVESERANDFYGTAVNRAARIMSVAHGGQILVSLAMASLLRDRLPRDLALRALGRVRLRDLREPEEAYQVVHPRLRADFPALRSLESTPNNLPHGLTSFIGRERELADVSEKLRTTRLLTIFGIGGLGKSRLSLQVAQASLDGFPDGVWFVELAPVADPRLVAQTLASVLGIRDHAGQSPHDAIMKFVRDRRLLIVLDNCEHVTQSCAELARGILQSGAGATILATSRERLGIGGEQTYPLAPFAVPPRQPLAPGALAQFASVRLLSERALSARPDFTITRENADAVASICQQLDGIPLALELAAARVRSMSVQKIAERLVDRFKLLSTGDRTALPRQQTLRALIDWSYDLLAPEEQALFRRLAVFAGGFTLEAAEDVAAGDGIAAPDVVDLVTQLVEKSLVMLDAEQDRYRMLETVRQYGDEKLSSEEDTTTRRRFVAHYVSLCESAAPAMTGSDAARWMKRIDIELENILSAHASSQALPGAGPTDLRIANALKHYWLSRGLLDLGLRTTLDALAREEAQSPDLNRGRGLFNAGQIAIAMGRYGEAQPYLEECLTIARGIGQRVGAVLQPLGQAAMGRGDLAAARAYLTEALAITRSGGETRSIAAALTELAHLHRLEGGLAEAADLYRQAVTLAREVGDQESVAVGLLNEAIVDIARGDSANAQSRLREVLGILAETGSRSAAQSALDVFAGLAALQGDALAAARFHGAAEALLAESHARRMPADEHFVRGRIDEVRQRLGEIAFVAAQQSGRDLDDARAIADAAAWIARGTAGDPA